MTFMPVLYDHTVALQGIIFDDLIRMPAWENINRVLSPLIQSSCLERGLLLRVQGCLAQSGRSAVLSQSKISVLITSDVQAGQGAQRDSGRLGCR